MARRYWLKLNGVKHYGTLAEVKRVGQEMADVLRRAVQVGWDEVKPKKPAARRFARNPDAGSFLDVWTEQERGRRARLDYLARTKPRRLAKGHQARAARPAGGKPGFAIDVRNKREAYTLAQPTRAAANTLARQYEAAGYQVQVREL
jgi:hypothetical protein